MRDTVASEIPAAAEHREEAEPVVRSEQPDTLDREVELRIRLQIRRLLDQIDLYRAEQGMTKTELARRAGLSAGHVCELLNHGGNPRLDTVVALVVALDCKLVVTTSNGRSYDC